MKNDWNRIWNSRKADLETLLSLNDKELFLKLKEMAGFDIVENKELYSGFMDQYAQLKTELMFSVKLNQTVPLTSVFEVGGGNGANLLLFYKDGVSYMGEIDYSEVLTSTAKMMLENKTGRSDLEITCGEAVQMSADIQYDAVFSNSVFSYFPDEQYAEKVLEKMLMKSKRNIAILDVHHDKKKEEFLAYRRTIIPDYDERYKNLPKLFYSKQFFAEFAEKHDLDIKFANSHVKGYWNNPFIFNCYMYRCDQ